MKIIYCFKGMQIFMRKKKTKLFIFSFILDVLDIILVSDIHLENIVLITDIKHNLNQLTVVDNITTTSITTTSTTTPTTSTTVNYLTAERQHDYLFSSVTNKATTIPTSSKSLLVSLTIVNCTISSDETFMNITSNTSLTPSFCILNSKNKFIDNYEWPVLLLSLFVIIGFIGNLLVCLAIKLYPKLQNATNYYLFSLAATDLLVSIIVIPLAIVKIFYSN